MQSASNHFRETISAPLWLDYKGRVNEATFATDFLRTHPMICIQGKLFTVDGLIEDEAALLREIFEMISGHVTTNLAKKSKQLLEAIKLACHAAPLPVQTDRIHVANGTYFLDGHFEPVKEFCHNRLPAAYLPEAGRPVQWLRFLDELLEAEDIPALQEFFGYALLPVTKAQKMLILIGKGGEGKSRVGLVLRSLLGENMNTGSIQKVETDRFARADLEYKLLMVGAGRAMRIFEQMEHYPIDIIANYGLQYGVYNPDSQNIDLVQDAVVPCDRESVTARITALREKHGLTMRVERYVDDKAGVPEQDRAFIRT